MSNKLFTPEEVSTNLDRYIIGQMDAKKALGIAIYNHFKRIHNVDQAGGGDLGKSNILMTGPTGSGKTHLTTTFAKSLGLPVFIVDATNLAHAASLDKAIENTFIKLIDAAGGNVNMAEKGIIVIDEIDKSVTGANRESGKGFQHAMLKILEGTTVNVNINNLTIPFNTKHVLFIACGTFVELSRMVRERLADSSAGALTDDELIKRAGTDDYATFGFVPEFMGRLPVLVSLTTLTKAELVRVLTEPVNSITSQYRKMFSIDGLEVKFAPDALQEIAEQAFKLKTGARGLRTVLEKAMTDIIFNAPDNSGKRLIITQGIIQGTEQPVYKNKE